MSLFSCCYKLEADDLNRAPLSISAQSKLFSGKSTLVMRWITSAKLFFSWFVSPGRCEVWETCFVDRVLSAE